MADPTGSAQPTADAGGADDDTARAPSERFGRFVLHSRLGTGGMGDVWLATDAADGSAVALKRVRAELSEEARRRLRLEVEALSRLAHPHICAVRDWGNEAGVPWFSMEALRGKALSEELTDARGRALALPLVRRIASAVTSALGAAHTARVIHRDLKPENVFLCEDGPVKLLDFGIAKVRDEDSGTSLYGTQGGRGRFTPQYMAPEQVTRKDPIGPATDLYALGVMLFELLTGRLPFESATPMGYVTQHIGEEPPPLSRFRPGTPRSLEEVVKRLLAKRPQDRYPSAEALAPALEAALSEAEAAEEELRARLSLAVGRAPPRPPAEPPKGGTEKIKAVELPPRPHAQPQPQPQPQRAHADPGRVVPDLPPVIGAPPRAGQGPPPAPVVEKAKIAPRHVFLWPDMPPPKAAPSPAPAPAPAPAPEPAPAHASHAPDPQPPPLSVPSPFPAVLSTTRTSTAPAPLDADDPRSVEYMEALQAIGPDAAERAKLDQVRRDLEREIRRDEASPFAFSRASGLSAALLERLEGRSLGDALADMALSEAELAELQELGRGLAGPRLSEATRRSGKIVFALAAARDVLLKGAPRDPATRRGLMDLVAGVRDKSYVTTRYRSVLDRAFARLSPGDGGRG